MFDTQLMLIATSALLIYIKNGLLQQMPGSPRDYRNVWDFYRSCNRFANLIHEITQHINVNDIELYPDIHQVINRFIEELNMINEFVRLCSIAPNSENFQNYIPNFKNTLEALIKGLYTTLCDKLRCPTCNPKKP